MPQKFADDGLDSFELPEDLGFGKLSLKKDPEFDFPQISQKLANDGIRYLELVDNLDHWAMDIKMIGFEKSVIKFLKSDSF